MLISVVAPEEAQTAIEPNVLTAPGRPGSVDKGERQVRGERLAVSTTKPATNARFQMVLRIEGSGERSTAATQSKN